MIRAGGSGQGEGEFVVVAGGGIGRGMETGKPRARARARKGYAGRRDGRRLAGDAQIVLLLVVICDQ